MYVVGNRQPPDYLDKIGAPALYNNYHFINQIDQNLQEISTSEIPFAPKQIEALIENNYIFDQTGEQYKILTFEWVNGSQKASVEYSKKSNKGTNTKTIQII